MIWIISGGRIRQRCDDVLVWVLMTAVQRAEMMPEDRRRTAE